MGWLLLIIWIVLGVLINIFYHCSENFDKDTKRKKIANFGLDTCMWIGIAILGILLLCGLGWLWYYFCCGFLVFRDPSIGWKIVWGITSLIPLGGILGLIAIFLGHNPFKD